MLDKFLQQLENNEFPAELPGHFIAGEWIFSADSPSEHESLCPSTGDQLAVSKTGKQDVKTAINCAFEYHLDTLDSNFDERISRVAAFTKKFRENAPLIIKTGTREQGKPFWEMSHEVQATLDYLEWVSNNGDFIKAQLLGPARLGHLSGEFKQKPAGIVAAYLPFSTTISTFGFYYAAALLSNCPVVMFSSKHNLLQSTLLANLVSQTELNPGAFQMVLGGFSDFKLALLDRRISAVLYTGSRDHCDEIREDSSSYPERRLILQSGGKNTAIIHETADMNLAVNTIFQGAFRASGQLCSSTNRVVVHSSKYEEFKSLCRDALKNMNIGPTHHGDLNPFMGPLFSKKAVERFLRYQTMAAREAEESISWGKAYKPEEDGASGGNYVTPGIHLMKQIEDSSYQKSVILCPDIAVYKYDNLSTGIKEIVNRTHASFAVSFFGDKEVLDEHAGSLEASNILHNLPTTEVEACLPLAGRYASGYHRFHGPSLAHYLLHPAAHQTRDQVEEKIKSWPNLI
jgi:acyl-CoA reductase-like NAD-dependent aldehyde dehydrogenase